MDYMFPSRNYETSLLTSDKLIIHGNLNLSQEEDPPLFLPFPSPFLYDMDTTTLLPNLHHDNQSTDGYRNTAGTTSITTANIPLKLTKTTAKPLASKLKCVRKKRTAGKKDRHSKIHTAQGLRDRRMRLSVHTARKFFDLNDMLGFDKASKTIEWLFNKSKKAIDEVAETLQADDAAQTFSRDDNEIGSPLSACETESVMEIAAAAEKDDQMEAESSRKQMEISPMVMETSGKESARDVERTRERMMNKNLEKPKQIFEADPIVNFHQSQLGFSEHEEHHNMVESSCFPSDFSNTYQFLKHLHLDNTVRNSTDTYLGNISAISSTNRSIFDYNKSIAESPPTGWLNSKNTFLGFLGGWDSENSRMVSNNGISRNIAPLIGGMNRENTSSGIISILKSKDPNHASLDHYQ